MCTTFGTGKKKNKKKIKTLQTLTKIASKLLAEHQNWENWKRNPDAFMQKWNVFPSLKFWEKNKVKKLWHFSEENLHFFSVPVEHSRNTRCP